ncbi:MAG: hypothetical protein AB7G37_08175 [Solirubrobacteraceae bacterium]
MTATSHTQPTSDELRRRVQEMLTQRTGLLHDGFDDPAHAPDHVGGNDLTHCRIGGAPDVWTTGPHRTV